MCTDPPAPRDDVDLLLWDPDTMSGGRTPYGTLAKYKCKTARKFVDADTGALYSSREIKCLWTADWSGTEVKGIEVEGHTLFFKGLIFEALYGKNVNVGISILYTCALLMCKQSYVPV